MGLLKNLDKALARKAPSATAPPMRERCGDELSRPWPDVKHNLKCGDCKVFVHHFSRKYGSTCNAYCESFGRHCVGAWEEYQNTCQVDFPSACNSVIDSNDAICECTPEAIHP